MREKRIRTQEKAEPLFDYPLDSFDPDAVFVLDLDGVPVGKLEAAAQADDKNYQRQLAIERAAKPSITPTAISPKDPLKPDLFIGHHRRMEREERRMQVQERQGLMTTALRLKTQKDQLVGSDWPDYIDRIVKIEDMRDQAELRRKRELAIHDMAVFLEKFDEYHRRVNRRDSKSKARPQKKTKPKPAKKPEPAPAPAPAPVPTYEAPKYPDLTLFFRPFVFGHMLPPKCFPPREFAPPPLLLREVESLDLVDALEKKRRKL